MGLMLEEFDGQPAPAAPGPSPDWLDGQAAGIAQGRAAALAEAEARDGALTRELVQVFEDAAFGYADARAAVLASLAPLLSLILDRLLPAFAAEALVPLLVEQAMAAAQVDSATPLVIRVAPGRAEAVRGALPRAGAHATVAVDPGLGPREARLAHAGRETALDLDACLAALREACSGALPLARRA